MESTFKQKTRTYKAPMEFVKLNAPSTILYPTKALAIEHAMQCNATLDALFFFFFFLQQNSFFLFFFFFLSTTNVGYGDLNLRPQGNEYLSITFNALHAKNLQ